MSKPPQSAGRVYFYELWCTTCRNIVGITNLTRGIILIGEPTAQFFHFELPEVIMRIYLIVARNLFFC